MEWQMYAAIAFLILIPFIGITFEFLVRMEYLDNILRIYPKHIREERKRLKKENK